MCYSIDEIKIILAPIAEKYGVEKASLFGSYARGVANDGSDVDLLIEKGQVNSLIKYYSLVNELEKQFKCHVDVVTTDITDTSFLKRIREDELVIEKWGQSL